MIVIFWDDFVEIPGAICENFNEISKKSEETWKENFELIIRFPSSPE